MPMEEKRPASPSNLPPPRTKEAIKPVKPPLHSTRFKHHIYALAAIAIFFLAYYAYRIFQWKTEVGGWWNMALGKRPPQLTYDSSSQAQTSSGSGERDLESRISDLADILGIKPTDLASAISDVVKDHIPPKTFSSLSSSASAAAAEKTAVQALFGVNGQATEGAGAAAKVVVDTLENVIGLDEPIELD